MPFIDKKKSTTFQLLYKNYDDVTYEDERTRGTLALKKVGGKVVRPSPDFEREWGLVPVWRCRWRGQAPSPEAIGSVDCCAITQCNSREGCEGWETQKSATTQGPGPIDPGDRSPRKIGRRPG